ncbi:MAG: tetratricopeptide repeat protein [Capnocytophaga sp.]|nr:tetratricopeptide repeat protein [Capnocytophaga sp.]
MTPQELSLILKDPNSITLSQVYELENIIHDFPFFQVARAVHLKVLYTQGSYRYNKALKITASHIGNRSVLFDFITSNSFKEINPNFLKKTKTNMPKAYYDEAIPSGFTMYVTEDAFQEKDKETENQENVDTIVGKYTPLSNKNKEVEESLQMGKPLNFQKNDSHSFSQWLEVTRYKPIDRKSEKKPIEPLPNVDKNIFEKGDARAKKFDLIDKFLEANPKIEVKKEYSSTIDLSENTTNERKLMTETLAKVYLEQGKYAEAIHAYQILILKYPEKTGFFTEQIKAIQKLQQNNL